MLFSDQVSPRSTSFSDSAKAAQPSGFVPVPSACLMGMSWPQMSYQQIYQQAWLQAQAALAGPRLLRMRVSDLPRVSRN